MCEKAANVQKKCKDLQKACKVIALDHFKSEKSGFFEAKCKEMRGDTILVHIFSSIFPYILTHIPPAQAPCRDQYGPAQQFENHWSEDVHAHVTLIGHRCGCELYVLHTDV